MERGKARLLLSWVGRKKSKYLDEVVEDVNALALRFLNIVAERHAARGARYLIHALLHRLRRHVLAPVLIVAEAIVILTHTFYHDGIWGQDQTKSFGK